MNFRGEDKTDAARRKNATSVLAVALPSSLPLSDLGGEKREGERTNLRRLGPNSDKLSPDFSLVPLRGVGNKIPLEVCRVLNLMINELLFFQTRSINIVGFKG